jgi:hypothetical protein
MARIDEIVNYPITYIGKDEAVAYASFPVDPAELARRTGWAYSKYDFEVVGISPDKAHVAGSGTRHREDDSVIESINAFYVFQRLQGRWKMTFISDIVHRKEAY